jgi:hypothetical protein
MKRKTIFLWIMFVCCAASASGQQTDHRQKRRFVVVPSERALVVVAHQPESPLQFVEAKLLAAMDGSEAPAYVVRHNGKKPIRSFTLGIPGGTITWSEELTKRRFMPGERTPSDEDDVEIVPLTEELRRKLRLDGPMKNFALFMVIRIEYADGSIYSAEQTYKALQQFSDELYGLQASRKPQ